jgi:autotransporter-associated beta strand protein
MKRCLLGTALGVALACFVRSHAAPITWIGVDPNNDMESPANWSRGTVPGSGDEAIFNSSIPNIALDPTEGSAPFSVSSFNFILDALSFNFQFNNQTLTFIGEGITGAMTNTQIEISNTDNSMSLGDLVSFLSSESTSGSAQLEVSNSATLSAGSNTVLGAFDSLFHASGDFTLGDEGVISVRNSGNDSASGTGNNQVANSASSQLRLDGTSLIGSGTLISVMNNGTFSGLNTVQSDTVAAITGSQFVAAGPFQAEENGSIFFDVRNSGNDQGQGVGGDFIGDIIGGQQVAFQGSLNMGENGVISIQNSGFSSSAKASGCMVGCVTGDGRQLLVQGAFLAGDNLSIFIQNTGNDSSTGAGGNTIGCVNTTSNSASQCQLASGADIGDGASFFMLNSGSRQVSTPSVSSQVSVLDKQQFYSASDFQAGNAFSIQAVNGGLSFGSGQSRQAIGNVGASQVEFEIGCTLGENAFFNLVNTGFNLDSTGTSNSISVINGCQLKAGGDFTAGSNLQILASNRATNFGDSSNDVGLVNDSQVCFEQACNLNDGSLIQASNAGTITNCQIEFLQGFNVLSGKAVIQAINSGTIGCFGINILGDNGGGNGEIMLNNSSLSIGTTLSTFTIGGLSGDSTSFAESLPTLIINTDNSTLADFSGAIQDFPSATTTLIKTGPGTQTLSGVNTYTGLTTVQGGALVVNGSIAQDLLVDTLGTLKGTGAIGGNLTNSGTIAPGESIGTLNVLGNYINNSGGIYAVEINGAGASDLINVIGQARLSGGEVDVATEDGIFQFRQPYTIVTAQGGVFGTYEGAVSSAFIDPILTYDLSHVFLTIEPALIKAAKTCNQSGVANVLDAILDPTSSQLILINTIANLTLDDAQKALENLSGFQYTQEVLMTEISVRRFLRNLYNPLRSVSCDELFTAWIETSGGVTHLKGKEAHRAHADSCQVTGGIQKTLPSRFTLGLAGSYEYDRFSLQAGNAHRHSRFIAAYGLYDGGPGYGLFDLVYGHTSSRFKRSIQINDIRDTADGKPKIDLFTFYGEIGFDLCCSSLLIQPFFGIQSGKNWRDHFKEKSSIDLGLSLHRHDWTSTSSRLGVHLTTAAFYNCIDVSLDLAWNERLSSHKNRTRGRFTHVGQSFPICGDSLSKASFDYALTASLCLVECWKGYIEVAGEAWSHASTCEILGGLEYTW